MDAGSLESGCTRRRTDMTRSGSVTCSEHLPGNSGRAGITGPSCDDDKIELPISACSDIDTSTSSTLSPPTSTLRSLPSPVFASFAWSSGCCRIHRRPQCWTIETLQRPRPRTFKLD